MHVIAQCNDIRANDMYCVCCVSLLFEQMPFQKVVVIDCAGHMLGRVASVIAKEVMNGQKVVCVRTEELNISGSLFRHQRMSFCCTRYSPRRGRTGRLNSLLGC